MSITTTTTSTTHDTCSLASFSASAAEQPNPQIHERASDLAQTILQSQGPEQRAHTTDYKLPPGSVSTAAEEYPGMLATQAECIRILWPVSLRIREMGCFGYTLGEKTFNSIMTHLLTLPLPVLKDPLWKQQMDRVMSWQGQHTTEAEHLFFDQQITSTSHNAFAEFCAYRASSEGFANRPSLGCWKLMRYVDYEKRTQGNTNPEVSHVSGILQNYLSKQAKKYLTLELRTQFVNFNFEHHQITINSHDWDLDALKNTQASTFLWTALRERIDELHNESTRNHRPLQILIETDDPSSDFVRRLKECAVAKEIFIKVVDSSTFANSKSRVQEGNFFLKGLSWQDPTHGARLSQYLMEKGLFYLAT